MKLIVTLLGTGLLIFAGWYVYNNYLAGTIPALTPPSEDITELIPGSNRRSAPVNETDFPLQLSEGTKLSIYAKGLEAPRDLIIDPNGHLIASIPQQGRVVLFNTHGNLVGLLSQMNRPHGLALDCENSERCMLYIAEEHQVVRYNYSPNQFSLSGEEVLFSLPEGGRHTTRSLLIHNDKLYTSIGSSCDTCVEEDFRRAAVYVSNMDGSDFNPYATGLRNSVFMAVRPGTDEIWATEMGRDFLGNDLPPDEVNILQDNAFYGWPFCYGKTVIDLKFEDTLRARQQCDKATPSHIDIQAHSAPLGLAFIDKNTLLVAYHGSWNRTPATGYKIVQFNLNDDGSLIDQQDYITGWLRDDGGVLGRPVDIVVKEEHTVYISDDKAGVIYRLEIQ
jgi:glucose/arabinose dehydrogenase